MKSWSEAFSSLQAAISKQFPNVDEGTVRIHADSIYDGCCAANYLEWEERNNIRPDDDIERLKKARAKIRAAAEELGQLGGLGGMAIKQMAQEVKKSELSLPALPLNSMDAPQSLRDFLFSLANRLGDCADSIDRNADPITSWADGNASFGRPRGHPRGILAYYAGYEAYDAFHKLSGRRPSVIVDGISAKATGPFLEFVSEVLESVGVEASAEAVAKKVCKERNPKKK